MAKGTILLMKLSMAVLILPMTSNALRRVGTRAWQRFLIARFPGGVQDLVVYLHRHRKDSWAQWMGCMVLQNMCMDNTENRRIAGEQGAIQAVVDALNRHRENKWVQAGGDFSLAGMCQDNTENKRIVDASGQTVRDLPSIRAQLETCSANSQVGPVRDFFFG